MSRFPDQTLAVRGRRVHALLDRGSGVSAANYPEPMNSTRQRDWHKVRHYAFVFLTATAFALLLQWTGWRPISSPVVALVILAALAIVPRAARARRSQRVAAQAADQS